MNGGWPLSSLSSLNSTHRPQDQLISQSVWQINLRMRATFPSKVLFCTFYGIFFTNGLSAACPRQQCTVKQFQFSQERDSLDNYALLGYTYKNLTVSSHKTCFEQCAWDCQCASFNYVLTANHGNCQLNEDNRFLKPGALKQLEGHSYHDIVIDYNVEVGMGLQKRRGLFSKFLVQIGSLYRFE